MNVRSPDKWWSTLKSAVFDSSSSLPPLVNEFGGLVCESVGKTDPLSDHFDSKQSREAVDQPLTCHPSPRPFHLGLQVAKGQRLLLDLDLCGCPDLLGMFSIFLKRTADAMASDLV